MKKVEIDCFGCPVRATLTKKKFTLSVDHAGNDKDFHEAIEIGVYKFLMALRERKLEEIMK